MGIRKTGTVDAGFLTCLMQTGWHGALAGYPQPSLQGVMPSPTHFPAYGRMEIHSRAHTPTEKNSQPPDCKERLRQSATQFFRTYSAEKPACLAATSRIIAAPWWRLIMISENEAFVKWFSAFSQNFLCFFRASPLSGFDKEHGYWYNVSCFLHGTVSVQFHPIESRFSS